MHRWDSQQASKAIRARWERQHAGITPSQDATLNGRLLRQITVADMLTGERHVLDFYGTRRLNRYAVQVDGKPWRECGWSGALAMVRRSCVRFGRER